MTTEPHRLRAQQQLANLLDLLRQQPDTATVRTMIELGEQLDGAIAAFHMEAIRFRMYTLGRSIAQHSDLPAEARTLYDAVSTSLEAAGFHTKSVPH
ncbi:MAG: hypothetical protein AB7I50_00825 [Vicinamibacterales bacterium]